MGSSTQKQTQTQETQQHQTQDEFLQSLIAQAQQGQTTQNTQGTTTGTGTTSQSGSQTNTGTQNQSGTSTSTSTSNLAGQQQQNVDLLMAGARDNYLNNPITPLTQEGRTAAQAYAQGIGTDLVNRAVTGDMSLMDPNRIFGVTNTGEYNTLAGDITSRINQNLMQDILPQVRGSAIANNSLGGSAEGLLTGRAIGESNAGLASALAGLQTGLADRNASLYNAAQSRAGTNYNLGLAPASTLETLGQAGRNDQSESLRLLQALTGTAGQYGGSTTNTGSQNQTGTSTQTGTTEQTGTNTQNTTQNQITTIDELMQKLGLTQSQGTQDVNSLTNSKGEAITKTGSSPFQVLGSILAVASLFG